MTTTFNERVDLAISDLESGSPEARKEAVYLHNELDATLAGLIRAGISTVGFDSAAYRLDMAIDSEVITLA